MPSTRAVFVSILWLCMGMPALAQSPRPSSTQAFVSQTQSWQQRWQGAVRNERVNAEWLPGDRVIYRLDDADGGWSFMTAGDGRAVEPAFDHDAVATGLASLLGGEADALPFARFTADGDALVAMLDTSVIGDAEHPIVTIDGDEVRPTTSIPGAFDARRVTRDSSGSGPATAIVIHNATDEPIRLFWLDNSGVPRPYEALGVGDTIVRTTFVGHVWSVRRGDTELERVIGEPRPTYLKIRESSPDSTPEPAPSNEDGADEPERPRVVIRDHNVIVVSADGERQLTTDGTPEDGFGGQIWMSPDERFCVVFKTKRATTRIIHFVEARPDGQLQPKLHSMPYAKPGDPIDVPRPWVFSVETGLGQQVDTALIPTPWSLRDVHWVDEGRFRLIYNQRGHEVLRLVEFDAMRGIGRAVVEEASDTFVDYAYKTFHRRLPDGNILWMSERSGWNHLYLLDGETGAVIRPLTEGDWLVRSVEGVDEDAGTVLLRVMGMHADQDPYHHHFILVDIETGERTVLTDADGTHTIERSPSGSLFTARYQRVDLPPVTELRRWSDGAKIATLAEGDASMLIERGWRVPERFVAKGRDGATDIWGVIFTPTDFDPAMRYPVIENIYAGPHGYHVPKTWSTWHGSREVAERGFVVVRIDGMGTNWRSKAFHDVAHKNLADSGFPDRIAWIRAAGEQRPWMDTSRVGIYGGSAGGQSSTRALIAHGDFYSAAVSDCGCHDNRVDKIWWNELWMGYPIGPHYEEQANATQAKHLTGNLMLVVGEVDRNVDPASTMQVVDALIEADKDFELLVMPGVGHGAAETPYARRKRAEFFQRHLGGPVPTSPAER